MHTLCRWAWQLMPPKHNASLCLLGSSSWLESREVYVSKMHPRSFLPRAVSALLLIAIVYERGTADKWRQVITVGSSERIEFSPAPYIHYDITSAELWRWWAKPDNDPLLSIVVQYDRPKTIRVCTMYNLCLQYVLSLVLERISPVMDKNNRINRRLLLFQET